MNSDKPINKLIEEFISEQDMKPYVAKNTLWVLHRFVNWMVRQRINVRKPQRKNIIHYKQSLIDEGKTPPTINTYLAPVRKYFAWLENNGIYTNIAAGIKSPKDDRSFRRAYLNPAQVVQLLESIPLDRITGKRDYAMINLMVCYGLRRVEVRRLLVSDLNVKDGDTVLMVQRKGRTYKEPIRIEHEVWEPIETYLLLRGMYSESDPVFANHSQYSTSKLSDVSITRIVKKYLKKLSDNKKLTCHSLRHSAGINLLKAGKSIYDVQQLLGHNSINTTQAYLRAIQAEQRYNNPLGKELIDLYRGAKTTPKNEQITVS